MLLHIIFGQNFILFITRLQIFDIISAMQHTHKILISLWMAGSAGRKHLMGILKFVNEMTDWTVQIANNITEVTPELIDADIDGFIGEITPTILTHLCKRKLPAVVFSEPITNALTSECPLTFMTDDNESIGQIGADYFLAHGNYASLSFLPDKNNSPWSQSRQKGFEKRLAEKRLRSWSCPQPSESLKTWLINLPKPAAILCAYDFLAKDVLDTCRQTKLKVPRQISLLGIDDDELVCDYSIPSLSSIRIDHADFGYCAARALFNLMNKRRRHSPMRLIRHPPNDVVERESTAPTQPITALVEKMQTFIKAHVREKLTVTDVATHARVSRRLADLRLKEATGKTIHETIQDIRLGLVVNYLKTTKMPINKISRLSGYANIQRLKYIFKSRYGVCMRRFRNEHTLEDSGVHADPL